MVLPSIVLHFVYLRQISMLRMAREQRKSMKYCLCLFICLFVCFLLIRFFITPQTPQPSPQPFFQCIRVRCMEHSLHLAAKHFIESVSPVSPASIRKKAAAALKMAREGIHINMEEFEQAMSVVDVDYDDRDSNGSGPDDWDKDTNFTPGDSLGKALGLVKQVS
jgi:hypothetical protein